MNVRLLQRDKILSMGNRFEKKFLPNSLSKVLGKKIAPSYVQIQLSNHHQ
jgi:hypothetical protein